MERQSYESASLPSIQGRSSSIRKPAPELPLKSASDIKNSPQSPSQQIHQRFVVADPVAFSYLEEDRQTTVLERDRWLEGYQSYVVEQWSCSRTLPTFLIIAFTGETTHSIKVGVLSVPADEESWSPRMRVYFKALAQYHARRKETPLGTFMVTNLSTFPSSLTIVLVPDGDLRHHREEFFVAEDLKRLGCSGRVGLSIGEPSNATQAKFHQLYKISDKISLYKSVVELVKLCQVALILFGCLGPEYADGLLCDITEAAINDWWTQIGYDLYNVEPSDGVLGPTTVAALLGTLMGARNRLNVYGAPVTKDVFDVEPTKRAIAYFQKTQRLRKTRRLDRVTLHRLHKATAKQASGDGWGVPRAVKSTMAELSGRGGEMVMDMVGRGEKANISEIETVDIERFATLVKGERSKWLWHGKPRKRTTRDMFQDIMEDQPLSTRNSEDQQGKDAQYNLSRASTIADHKKGPSNNLNTGPIEPMRSITSGTLTDVDVRSKQGAFRRAKGRLKGVVGKRTPLHDDIKPDNMVISHSKEASFESLDQFDEVSNTQGRQRTSTELQEAYPHDDMEDANTDEAEPEPTFTRVLTETPPPDAEANLERTSATLQRPISRTEISQFGPRIIQGEVPTQNTGLLLLRRTKSLQRPPSDGQKTRNENWWPRSLSFSVAADSVLPLPQSPSTPPQSRASNPKADLVHELLRAESARQQRRHITDLSCDIAEWVSATIGEVEHLDVLAGQDADQLHHLYYPRKEEFATLQESAREIVGEGNERLVEALKDVEMLGQKLEYEIGSLRGKVEDVEGAVSEFERQVVYAEGRVRELVSGENREGWFNWAGRRLFGMGVGVGLDKADKSKVP